MEETLPVELLGGPYDGYPGNLFAQEESILLKSTHDPSVLHLYERGGIVSGKQWYWYAGWSRDVRLVDQAIIDECGTDESL